jgi:hypothetical protein
MMPQPAAANLSAPELAAIIRTRSRCRDGAIIGYSPLRQTITVIPMTCKMWSCPKCGPSKRAQWRAIIKAGRPTKWMRLGCVPSRDGTPAAALEHMNKAWDNLVLIIRRRFKDFQYVRVAELNERGWPHFHVAFRGAFVPHAWLSLTWSNLGCGPDVHVAALDNPGRVDRYLLKYITKATGAFADKFPGSRVISKSQSWIVDPLKQQDYLHPPDMIWMKSDLPLWRVYAQLSAAHAEIIEHNDRTDAAVFRMSPLAAHRPRAELALPVLDLYIPEPRRLNHDHADREAQVAFGW